MSMMSVFPRDEAQWIGARPYCNKGSTFDESAECNIACSMNSVSHICCVTVRYKPIDFLLVRGSTATENEVLLGL